MTEFPYKLGALPPDPAKPKLLLSPVRDTSFPVPGSVDYHSEVHGEWGMYFNDRCGDCTFAELAHQVISAATYARGWTGWPWRLIRERDTLAGYENLTGYDPSQTDPFTGQNPTDQGALIQDVLNYWRTTGVGGHRCTAFASVNVADVNELMHVIAVFGSADVGLQLPNSAMQQFRSGLPWDVVPDDGGIAGGHCVAAVGYDANYVYVVTWGRVVRMTWAFWHAYVVEAWAVILPEWLDAQGFDPTGFDLYALEEQLHGLTGVRTPMLTRHLDFAAAGRTEP